MPTAIPDRHCLDNIVVLVVDDVDDLRFLVSRILKRSGASIVEASSVKEAIHVLKAARPHVIVSDIAMPDADGYELIRTLREEMEPSTSPRTPAIALTSFAQESDRQKSLDAGFQAHVVKPFDHAGLVHMVAKLAALNGSAVASTWQPRSLDS